MSSLAAISFLEKAPGVAGSLSDRDLETMVSRFDEQMQELKDFLQDKNLQEVTKAKSGSVFHQAHLKATHTVGASVHKGAAGSHLPFNRGPVSVTPREANAILERAEKLQQDSDMEQRLKKLTRKKRRLSTFVAVCSILSLVSFVQLYRVNDLSLWPVVREMTSEQSAEKVISAPETVAQIPAAPAPVVQEAATPPATPPAGPETTPEPPRSTLASSPSATPPEVAAPATRYVGSVTSNKYHQPDCKWAKTIRPEKVRVFTSAADAHQAGYHQCPVCKPPVADAPASPSGMILCNATS